MHAARGPEPTILPLVPPTRKSEPFRLSGVLYQVVGPTDEPPPPNTTESIPALGGGMYHFVDLEPGTHD